MCVFLWKSTNISYHLLLKFVAMSYCQNVCGVQLLARQLHLSQLITKQDSFRFHVRFTLQNSAFCGRSIIFGRDREGTTSHAQLTSSANSLSSLHKILLFPGGVDFNSYLLLSLQVEVYLLSSFSSSYCITLHNSMTFQSFTIWPTALHL